MTKIISKKIRGISGFTLIELLVVIAIIGVLASIVLASLNSARVKARNARRITDIKQIQLAMELYYDSSVGAGNYPAAGVDCTTLWGLNVLATNNFIPVVPQDPNSGTCYRYATLTTGVRTLYHLAAILESEGSSQPAAMTGDRDCSSVGAPACPGGAYSGALSNGSETATCTGPSGVAGTDRCYDVVP